ncbi:MAG: hypothetical protein K9N21_08980 [Deltaproteobacteria bacterium]|nr:hypothetical protein [Deltaproteobacteria bacterium]
MARNNVKHRMLQSRMTVTWETDHARDAAGMIREIRPVEELLNEIVVSAQEQIRLLGRYTA